MRRYGVDRLLWSHSSLHMFESDNQVRQKLTQVSRVKTSEESSYVFISLHLAKSSPAAWSEV